MTVINDVPIPVYEEGGYMWKVNGEERSPFGDGTYRIVLDDGTKGDVGHICCEEAHFDIHPSWTQMRHSRRGWEFVVTWDKNHSVVDVYAEIGNAKWIVSTVPPHSRSDEPRTRVEILSGLSGSTMHGTHNEVYNALYDSGNKGAFELIHIFAGVKTIRAPRPTYDPVENAYDPGTIPEIIAHLVHCCEHCH